MIQRLNLLTAAPKIMQIDKALVARLAELSKLEFDETEMDAMTGDLQKMLNFCDRLREVKVEGVEPLIFMNDEVNRWREDEVTTDLSHEEALLNAPKKDSDYFKVPKVLGKG